MLRVNRVYGADDNLVNAARFARWFRGGSSSRAADRAQISRWERGVQLPGHATLCRYEELLGLPRASLYAIADTVYREVPPSPGKQVRRRIGRNPAGSRRQPDELLDTALGSCAMTGDSWDLLTAHLVGNPGRDAPWERLTQRLLAELIVAQGIGWQLRSTAIGRLLADKRSRPALISACSALGADPGNQVFIEPLTILDGVSHRDAARQIIRHVVNPVNEHARLGAWWAAAGKASRNQFTDGELRLLAEHGFTLLAGHSSMSGCAAAVAELLRWIPPALLPKGYEHRAVRTSDQSAAAVLPDGRMMPAAMAAVLVTRIAWSAMSGLRRDSLNDDPMLRILVDEMLFHPQLTRRTVATHMIEFTPYRQPVAAALVRELSRPGVRSDPTLAVPLLQALSALGDRQARTLIENVALDQHFPQVVVEAAIWSLAHIPGTGGAAYCSATTDERFIARLSDYAVRGLVYGAGIGGRTAWLSRVRIDPAMPHAGRAAARWWLNQPRHVLESVAQPRPAPV
ncbi:hypothetical protein ACIA8B_30245 [Micromonospora chalcea]